jgi:hypothetical protein
MQHCPALRVLTKKIKKIKLIVDKTSTIGDNESMLKIRNKAYKANRNPKCSEIILFNTWAILLFWKRRGKYAQMIPKLKFGRSTGILG